MKSEFSLKSPTGRGKYYECVAFLPEESPKSPEQWKTAAFPELEM